MQKPKLPQNFRKIDLVDRQQALVDLFQLTTNESLLIGGKVDLSDLADVLVESSIGTYPTPLGLASGFLVNDEDYVIPMATEEPSVIAAATHTATLVKASGGFKAWSDEPVMTAQIFLTEPKKGAKDAVINSKSAISEIVNSLIPNMTQRGGGFRSLEAEVNEATNSIAISIHIDVRDAMGANVVNTVAEGLKDKIAEITGGKVLMAILTNAASKRVAGASFSVAEKYFRKGSLSGAAVCQKIVLANEIANAYPERAATQNKGIMNGISALALATGNDTRAIEAAAHFYAQRNEKYQTLTSYSYKDGYLHGKIELPLALGTIGGSVGIWPHAELALKILQTKSAQNLCQVAAALGLAQNLAALFALVTGGIQSGHMKLHAAKTAYQAGARGKEIRAFTDTIWKDKIQTLEEAKKLFSETWGNS